MSNNLNTINKCLFPAAGFGTRFLPATKAIPKEMLPILTKPLLQFGVEEALSANIANMAIITGRGKRAIEDHFDHSFEIEAQLKGTSKESFLKGINSVMEKATFSYIRQKKMLGLGNAIYTGKVLVGREPFAVILPDDLCMNDGDSVTQQMIELYSHHPECCIVAIEEVASSDVHKYGIIDGDLLLGSSSTFRVNNMVEKPSQNDSPSNLAIIGRYILTPEIFDELEKISPDINGEIQITNALMNLAKKGMVLAYKFEGRRFDCGSVAGFVSATNYFAKAAGLKLS